MRLVGRLVLMEQLDIAWCEFGGRALLGRCKVAAVVSIMEFRPMLNVL